MVLFVTNITSCGKGDNEGDGCSLGLAGIDGDGLGVRNDPGGESIPVRKKKKKNIYISLVTSVFSCSKLKKKKQKEKLNRENDSCDS